MQIMNRLLLFLAFFAMTGLYLPLGAENEAHSTVEEEKTAVGQDASIVQDTPIVKEPVRQEPKVLTSREFVPVAALRIKEAIVEKGTIRQEFSLGLIDAQEFLVKITEQNRHIDEIKRQLQNLCRTTGLKQCARAMATHFASMKKELDRQKDIDSEVLKELDNEIYEQKVIAGQAMSRKKKLLIGAAIVAAAGVAVTYFTSSRAAAEAIIPAVADVIHNISQNASKQAQPESDDQVTPATDVVPEDVEGSSGQASTSSPSDEQLGNSEDTNTLGQNGVSIQGTETDLENQDGKNATSSEAGKWVALSIAGAGLIGWGGCYLLQQWAKSFLAGCGLR